MKIWAALCILLCFLPCFEPRISKATLAKGIDEEVIVYLRKRGLSPPIMDKDQVGIHA
jgi:hypothetical protein